MVKALENMVIKIQNLDLNWSSSVLCIRPLGSNFQLFKHFGTIFAMIMIDSSDAKFYFLGDMYCRLLAPNLSAIPQNV